jgi:predicted dehydrogenase
MPDQMLGVGIIGVNPAWGWAVTAHIPALRALPNYEIPGLSSRSAESARAAGEEFGIKAVFPDHEQLVIQPDVDVVAVTGEPMEPCGSPQTPHSLKSFS